MKKVKNTKGRKINIISIIIAIIFALLTGLLIFNLIRLNNIETVLRIVAITIMSIILIALIIFQKKKKILCRIIMIILSLIYIFLNYTFYKVYSSLDSITSNVDTKGICLVANTLDMDSIDDIDNGDIAIVGKTMDEAFYEMALDIINSENLKNKMVEYEDYFQIINALLKDEIKYAFLPENYNAIYSANSGEEEPKELGFSVLYTEQKLIESKNEVVSAKKLNEPFSVLLMGTDVILDSYNADTLMVLTVNPKTLKVTMLSIPRDSYTTIACSGGKHKINASGWYGDSCVVKTVEKYLSIDIDYYAKINFFGVVDLVDALGGVEVDVPYAFCEQNSKRQWGNNAVYVDSGLQTLDGEEALALSRNRHYWKGTCPEKYTTEGNRSDLTRGQNQQLVIKAILSKLMTVRDINTFYKILDTIGNNMTTDMPKDTILSLYNVGKSIVKRLSATETDDIINIEKLALKNHFATVHISGLDLSMIVNYNESIDYVSKQMKKNLGLINDDVIKDISFDINEEYDPDTVKYNKLTSNLSLLSNLVGKTLGDALSYCSKNNITCNSSSNDMNAIVVSQSIAPKTDITTMRNKTVTLEVESVVDKNNNNNSNSANTDKNTNTNNNETNKEEDKETPKEDNDPANNDNTSNNNDSSNNSDTSNNDTPTPNPDNGENTENNNSNEGDKENNQEEGGTTDENQ